MRGTRLRVQQKRVPLETLSNLDSRPTNPILLEFYSRIIKSNLGEKRKEEEKTEGKKKEEKNEKKKRKRNHQKYTKKITVSFSFLLRRNEHTFSDSQLKNIVVLITLFYERGERKKKNSNLPRFNRHRRHRDPDQRSQNDDGRSVVSVFALARRKTGGEERGERK